MALCELISFKRWHFRVSKVTEWVFEIIASNFNSFESKSYGHRFPSLVELLQFTFKNLARATRLSLQIQISLSSNHPLGNWAQNFNVTFETFKCHLLKWIVINNYHTVHQLYVYIMATSLILDPSGRHFFRNFKYQRQYILIFKYFQ